MFPLNKICLERVDSSLQMRNRQTLNVFVVYSRTNFWFALMYIYKKTFKKPPNLRDATIFRKHPNASTQCKALPIRNQNWYPSFTFMNNNGVLWWRCRNYSGADTRYWQGVGAGVSPHTIMSSLTNSRAIIALNHVLGITAISPSENVLQLIWIWNLTLCNRSF